MNIFTASFFGISSRFAGQDGAGVHLGLLLSDIDFRLRLIQSDGEPHGEFREASAEDSSTCLANKVLFPLNIPISQTTELP